MAEGFIGQGILLFWLDAFNSILKINIGCTSFELFELQRESQMIRWCSKRQEGFWYALGKQGVLNPSAQLLQLMPAQTWCHDLSAAAFCLYRLGSTMRLCCAVHLHLHNSGCSAAS
jgi:hypothetical protein